MTWIWPINVSHPSGPYEWLRDGHVTQTGPVRVRSANCMGTVGKRSPLPPGDSPG